MKKIRIRSIIFVLFAILFAAIFIYPIYFTVVSSFKNNNEIWNTMFSLPSKIEWSNYTSAIQDVKILKAVLNSFIFSLGASFVVVIVVTMAAYVCARNILKVSKFLKTYYLLGMMVPPYAMLIPVVTMFTRLGFRDKYWPMILLYAAINFPMSFYLISSYIEGISQDLDEVALLDGCDLFTLIFRIIFPIARPGIFTGAIITFLAVYNELIFANTLLTNQAMKTISVRLLGLQGERFTSYGPMFASIVLSVVPILIVYLIFQDRVEGGIAEGAVKG
ncbi:MAG: carbohydrate ABC transporter permease [Blautia sp.]|nr:carbohydrate ABC transporter permease [Blautia sp.]